MGGGVGANLAGARQRSCGVCMHGAKQCRKLGAGEQV